MTNQAHLSATLNHPQRIALASEVHARPFMQLEAPAQLTHLAVFSNEGGPTRHQQALADLCMHFGVAAPATDAKHFFHDFGSFRLKWELHTEFSAYSFLVCQPPADGDGAPFAHLPIERVPQDWLQKLAGCILVGAHLVLEAGATMTPLDPRLRKQFAGTTLVGSRVLAGGEVWTDFQLAPDGFTRFLIRDTGLRETQAGRLLQRVFEIETYRMMALLALPLARETAPQVRQMEQELTTLSAHLVSASNRLSDEELLHLLTQLAARVESLALLTSYRFSAGQAYHRLVKARITELREERIEGVPTIDEFMERRLSPAMDTCTSAAARQESLAQRVSRTNDLLRTRVGIMQEKQTQAVLHSLSRNAGLQVRLQQAVEGLSVVAISYYLVGLLGYGLKALKSWGLHLDIDGTLGIVLPLACGITWFGLQRMHHRLSNDTTNSIGTETRR